MSWTPTFSDLYMNWVANILYYRYEPMIQDIRLQ